MSTPRARVHGLGRLVQYFPMYERRSQPLLFRAEFFVRMRRHAFASLGIVGVSLGVGVLGYHLLEGQRWIDALLNAFMILGGMGPVDTLHTTAGKVFASVYALYSGLVVLVAAGVLFAPIMHRSIHRFHLEDPEDDRGDRAGEQSGGRNRGRGANVWSWTG